MLSDFQKMKLSRLNYSSLEDYNTDQPTTSVELKTLSEPNTIISNVHIKRLHQISFSKIPIRGQ